MVRRLSRATTAVLLVGLTLIGATTVLAAEPTLLEPMRKRQGAAGSRMLEESAAAIARTAKAITPQHLADCKTKAEVAGGASFFLTLKVTSPLVPHLGHTCLKHNAFNRERSFAVYVATIANADGRRRPPGTDQLACEFELINGVISLSKVGIAPGLAPSHLVTWCGFSGERAEKPVRATPSATPSVIPKAVPEAKAVSTESESKPGRGGTCPSFMLNGTSCTDAAGRSCTRMPSGRVCS